MKVIDDGLLDAAGLPVPRTNEGGETVARLFKAQSRRLASFLAKRLRSHEDAQDASQDVFLKLWRQEQSGQLRGEATAYLFSAARNVAIDCERWRQSHRIADTVELEEEEFEQLDDPHIASADEAQHWRKGLDVLLASLRELPERTQQAFMLYHFDGLSYAEIASRLGVSERSVERDMARAFGFCRLRLEEYL